MSLTKHLSGKHNQKTHGRSGAARAAYGAAYGDAIGRGESHESARRAARDSARIAMAPAPAPVEVPQAQAAPPARVFKTGGEADKTLIRESPIKADDLDSATMGALQHYQHEGYKPINDGLRTGNRAKLRENRAEIERIDSVMNRSPIAQPVTAYRAMVVKPGTPAAALLESMIPGAEFKEMGYMSTTVDQRRLNGFVKSIGGSSGAQRVNVRVHVPAGTKATYMNAVSKPRGMQDYREERELLIARGSRYRVVSRAPGAGGSIDIEVEIIP